MGTYVTPEGYIYPDYAANKLYWETVFQGIFGDDIDLDSTGPIGQMVATFAKRDTDLFEMSSEVYYSRDVDQATGVALDAICAETGVIRLSATPTTVDNVFMYGTIATLIEAGKQAKQSSGDFSNITYTLLDDVTISLDRARDILIEVSTAVESEDYTITLDGTVYTHTAGSLDDQESIAAALVVLIDTGDFEGVTSNEGAVISIRQDATNFTISYTVNITLNKLANAGSFQADTVGVIPLPAETLVSIVTPVPGWDSVINPSAGFTGRETETDSELRIRRANTLTTGNATEDALVAAISNKVPGVTRVGIQSNRTDVVDSEGLDPHSFELIISGGLASDIAQVIWDTQGAGIASFGTTEVVVEDSQGFDQSVYFSRPTDIYLWVRTKRDLYDEEMYPDDGDSQIKQAIVDWALLNQPIGKDVIRQRLSIPVYSIPGISDIEITIDSTPTSVGPPTYAEQNIDISLREVAIFDIERQEVEALTP